MNDPVQTGGYNSTIRQYFLCASHVLVGALARAKPRRFHVQRRRDGQLNMHWLSAGTILGIEYKHVPPCNQGSPNSTTAANVLGTLIGEAPQSWYQTIKKSTNQPTNNQHQLTGPCVASRKSASNDVDNLLGSLANDCLFGPACLAWADFRRRW